MKVLVVVINYYADKLPYLKREIKYLKSLKGDVDIYVFTKHFEDLQLNGVKVIQGSSYTDWQFPWTARPFIVDRADKYDLFVVCDDDVLVVQRHVDMFLKEEKRLATDYIPGFLVVERHPQSGKWYTVNMHTSFHPAIRDYHNIDGRTYFTPFQVHSAMFMATNVHLRRAIESGNFGTEPERSITPELGYSEFAMSNIYVNCGLTKVVPCDDIKKFCVHHLPNKFVQYSKSETWNGRYYLMDEVQQMVQARLTDLPLVAD